VNIGNYTLMRAVIQLDGAMWMYFNVDGSSIIREIHNLRVWGGVIREIKNSVWELHLYEGYEATLWESVGNLIH
jgi:hypothetical protein